METPITGIKFAVDYLKALKQNPKTRLVYWTFFALGILVWIAVIGAVVFLAYLGLKNVGILECL